MIVHESNAAYHASAPISKSRLWEMRKTPLYFKWYEEHRSEMPKTDALVIGSAFHKLVLEPEEFDSEFAVCPTVDRRTKAGKEEFAAFQQNAEGKSVLMDWMFDQVKAMAETVRSHPMAGFLTTDGEVETSIYFTDNLTGVECKVRPDIIKTINGKRIIVDLKSCRSASLDDFRKDAINMGYDLQAAMYREGVKAETGEECDFVFVAVEKEPPYMINIIQCDELLLKRGGDLYREYLGMYKECSETGNWYGYNGAFGIINNMSLPSWLASQYEN